MKILIIIDMQNDFINGVLGSNEKHFLPARIKKYLDEHRNLNIFFTQDTHCQNEESEEFHKLPAHCIKNSDGWKIVEDLLPYANQHNTIEKKSFMSDDDLIEKISSCCKNGDTPDFYICGVCTDICVISNAYLLRREFPQSKIYVLSDLCMGSTVQAHKCALDVMKASLFDIL